MEYISTPPAASKRPTQIMQHGQARVDDYFWLRDKDDPETFAYLKKENEYLEAVLQKRQPLQARLFEELKSRLIESDLSVPERWGDYEYYRRMEPNKQYPIYCRKKVTASDGGEEVLLDQNRLAEGKPFCALGAFEVSPDQTRLAYAVDYNGSEDFSIEILDLKTGQLLPDRIQPVWTNFYARHGLKWADDSQTLFYTTFDHTHRPDKIFRHRLGSDSQKDELVYHEANQEYFAFLYQTRSRAYLVFFLHSHFGDEVRYLPASQPESQPTLLKERQPGIEYWVEHQGDHFVILTNQDAVNFKLMFAPTENPAPANWQEILPNRPDVLVETAAPFQDYLVLIERKEGLRQIRISAPDALSRVCYVPFPEPIYSLALARNPEYKTDKLRFRYSSLITPDSVVDYDMRSGEWELKKRDEIPGGYDPGLYETRRLFASSADGKQVPISLVYRKGLQLDGKNPALLTGYGSYGFSFEPAFEANILSLLERGFVYAIAHVRGGSELGRSWYEDGRLLNKKNSFLDFIACAEYLIQCGYTSEDKLAITGASAGGLLVCAAMTMRPELFRAVVARVPFVDVVNSMSDPSIPLTVIEYKQWGNPEDRQFFDYMMSYSPYDNLRPAAYPDVYLTTGINDPRVAFWEPAKFAARLREVRTNEALVLLKTNFNAGHGGASGRYNALKDVAIYYTFICDRLGIEN